MFNLYLAPFVISALISAGLTYYVMRLAQKLNFTDLPSPRKIHTKPIPRLGGVAIVLTFLFIALGYSIAADRLNFSEFNIWLIDKRLFGVLLGILVLLTVGIIDDIRGIAPWKKLLSHLLAAGLVVAFGLTINYIRIPGGNVLELSSWVIPINIFNHGYQFVVWGDLLTILWIVTLINTMNFLDGLDGLSSGISVIAAVSIFFLCLYLNQPAAALLSIIFAGSVFGFLPWNFNPAKIFMGDSGSMFLGFMLGVLSLISGGKLATAFLILGLPVIDVLWVILRRIFNHKSPFQADKLHLHHRLINIGLSQKQAVVVLYLIAAIFGAIAVFAGTQEKIQAFYFLLCIAFVLIIALVILGWRKNKIA